jgi:hypothetical protein
LVFVRKCRPETNSVKTLTNTTLRNYASAVWKDGGGVSVDRAVWENFSTLEILNNATMTGVATAVFKNKGTGTVKKVDGAQNTLDIVFESEGALLLNGLNLKFNKGLTQTGTNSLTDLGGGTLTLGASGQAAVYDKTGGVLKGGGEVVGVLNATGGAVEVGDNPTKNLKVTGSYTQGAGAALRVTVRAGGVFGLLDVTGAAQLSGSVEVVLPDGPPLMGTVGTIVQAAGGAGGSLSAPVGWEVPNIPPGATTVTLKKTT